MNFTNLPRLPDPFCSRQATADLGPLRRDLFDKGPDLGLDFDGSLRTGVDGTDGGTSTCEIRDKLGDGILF